MLRFPQNKLHNAYIIETNDYESTKRSIMDFAIRHGFERELVVSGNHPDIVFFESANEKFNIAELRAQVIDESYYSPKVNDRKFYIIYDAVKLDGNMQNALLKTLEEPPGFDTFFLVTTNANNLYETVKSRAMLLHDDKEEDIKKLLTYDFTDEAVLVLANIKYETESNMLEFAEIFKGDEEKLKKLIKLYRYILRDAFFYKKTLSKNKINIKEKETEIISIANTLSYEEIGRLIDLLDELTKLKSYQVDKKVAVFNFLSGGKNGKMLGNKV